MVTKPPRLVAVVSLCTMGPGIVARLGKRLCFAGLRLACPFYRKKGTESSFACLRMRHVRRRSLARDRQARLIGWAPTAKRVRITVWLSCTGSLAGVLVRVWWVGLPRFINLAKVGLANGQPGSGTKSVGTDSPGTNSQKMALVLISPRITVS